jgi:hypothetical protein
MVHPRRTTRKSTRRQPTRQLVPRDVPPLPEPQPDSPQYVPQGGLLWDCGHGTDRRRHTRSSTTSIERRSRQWSWGGRKQWGRRRRGQQGWRQRWWRLHSLEQRWEGWDVPRCRWDQDRQKWSPDPHRRAEGFTEPSQHHHSAGIQNQEGSTPLTGRAQSNRGDLQRT